METFDKNLRALMDIKEFTAEQIAVRMGVSTSTVTHWSNGRRFPTKEASIRSIANILQVQVSELFGEVKQKQVNNNNFAMLPSYNIMAGAGAEGFLPDVLESTKIPIANQFLNGCNPDFMHIIQVAGDSMQPTIRPNDWLIIDMVSNGQIDRHFEKVDGIYLVSKDGSIQIKRLAFRGTKGVDIISDNTLYPIENTLDRGIELNIIGKLFKHVQDLGSLAITELS